MGEQEFGRLTGELASSSPGGSGSEAGSGKWRYRNCPVCGDMMQRRNYGRMSGIIIDTCRQHGVWLDLDELPRILQWIRTGGLAHAQQQVAQQQKTEDITRRLARPTPGGRVTLNDSWEESDRPSSDLDLVFTALQAFFR
ncbi:MAG: hypothetical protein GTO03_00580 [Planctomycetales bacterium]|nr:hypothetical protein [Planctomycetales bacterium]